MAENRAFLGKRQRREKAAWIRWQLRVGVFRAMKKQEKMAGKREDFLARTQRNAERSSNAGSVTEEPRVMPALEKSLTGIAGFDEITKGGVPKGRPTIVCGGPGCGKTMFALEFLVRGATKYNEPGVLMTFEETGEEITKNVAS